jgi:hypothetical protein
LWFFSARGKYVFAGGFGEIGVLDVVFWGQIVVDCVVKMVCGCAVFEGWKFCSFLGFIFGRWAVSRRGEPMSDSPDMGHPDLVEVCLHAGRVSGLRGIA